MSPPTVCALTVGWLTCLCLSVAVAGFGGRLWVRKRKLAYPPLPLTGSSGYFTSYPGGNVSLSQVVLVFCGCCDEPHNLCVSEPQTCAVSLFLSLKWTSRQGRAPSKTFREDLLLILQLLGVPGVPWLAAPSVESLVPCSHDGPPRASLPFL